MAHRIRIYRTGGPEVLLYEEYDVGEPGPGQVRLVQEAAGVNFVDTQFRDGIYKAALPLTLGVEGVGIVDALGPGVVDFQVGDRVGYWLAFGGYADVRLVDVVQLVKIPTGIASEHAASLLTKGLSAWAMVRKAHVVRPGETVLVQGASGGVGLLATSWARVLGARVIATASGPARTAALRGRGVTEVLDVTDPDFVPTILNMTGGGVDVVYDLVGAATFDTSVAVIRPGGNLVHFGSASGQPRIDRTGMAERGIVYSKPDTGDFIDTRPKLVEANAELWHAVESGALPLPVVARYPLCEVRRAHEDIAARSVTGSMVLVI